MAKLEPGKFDLTPANHEVVVKNLLKRTREFSPETVKEGVNWYPSGKQDSEHVGEGDVEVGASMLSKLSPQKDWTINRQMGLQMHALPSGHLDPIREAFHGKASKEELSQIRSDVLGESPLKSQTTAAILGAENVQKGKLSPKEAFKTKGTGSKKTGDFKISLASGGEAPTLPVDTHAYDAALDRYDIPYGTGSEHMKSGHAYDFIKSAYTEAHKRAQKAKLIPKDMTLAGFQATHWVHHQLGKALYSTKVEAQARNAVRSGLKFASQDKNLDPSTHGLAPLQTEEQLSGRLAHFAAGAGGH
jgi:hypothetical protein